MQRTTARECKIKAWGAHKDGREAAIFRAGHTKLGGMVWGVPLKSEKRLLRPLDGKNAKTPRRASMQRRRKGARRPLFYRHQEGACIHTLSCSARCLIVIQRKACLQRGQCLVVPLDVGLYPIIEHLRLLRGLVGVMAAHESINQIHIREVLQIGHVVV